MTVVPGKTQYVKSGDNHIAWSVTGDGPVDVLYVPTWLSQLEHLWEYPPLARFFERLASFSRLIIFDRRGSGMSDSCPDPPTLEQQMDDVIAVMDAAGSDQAALFAQLEGGPMAMLFAATHPSRVTGMLLYATFARTLRADDMPWAPRPEEREAMVEGLTAGWGSGARAAALAPVLAGDAEFVDWFGKLERLSISPGGVPGVMRQIGLTDVRDVLPTIRVPTIVVCRENDPFMDPRHSEYLAEKIPSAHLKVLGGAENLIFGDGMEDVLDEAEEFLTGQRPQQSADRVLATVLFTDIVDSTARAAELGDRSWKALLERHDDLVRRQLARYQGREVKTTGDGFLATFDGPARAIRCATAINAGVRTIGITTRAGLHTGECEVRGDDVAGMAVHIGARVGATARPGEVLVSSTVKDLVVGSGIEFAERGEHSLKGVPGEWRLFAVAD